MTAYTDLQMPDRHLSDRPIAADPLYEQSRILAASDAGGCRSIGYSVHIVADSDWYSA